MSNKKPESAKALFTNWNVITGGPCTGKTTVIDVLSKRGYKTTIENARHYIDTQAIDGRTTEEVRRNKKKFQIEVFKIQLDQENALDPAKEVFLDRALPDAIGYFNFLNLRMEPEFEDACRKFRYKNVFVLDRLPLTNDYARLEDEEEQIRIHKAIIEAYKSLSYRIIMVPVLPVEERVDFILDNC